MNLPKCPRCGENSGYDYRSGFDLTICYCLYCSTDPQYPCFDNDELIKLFGEW
jgi:hypothetical protein